MVPSGDSETSDVVVDDSPSCCLPSQRSRQYTIYTDSRSDSEKQSANPVELVENVFELEGWKLLLCFEGMLDVVGGNR
jgi:hypothetical protein